MSRTGDRAPEASAYRWLEWTLAGLTTRSALDGGPVLTAFLVVLFVIPARLVVAPLGAAGTPAQIVGMAALVWWAVSQLARLDTERRTVQPVRRSMAVFGLALLASYVAGAMRPIGADELRSADRGLLSLCAWAGILLVAADTLPTRDRLDTLLRRLVLGGGALAAVGILQFYTGLDLARFLQIPGLSPNGDFGFALQREAFRRPSGTATHPIEFGVVLAMILPVALHFALRPGRHRVRRWLPVGLMGLALPISLSRSAIVGLVVLLLVLVPSWPAARRRTAYGVILGFVLAVYVGVPGLLGTLRNLFTGLLNGDASTQSRTGSYSVAAEYIAERPVFGRGYGTFLNTFHILDNQYLGMVIDAGFVGLAALLGLFATGVLTARGVRRRSTDEETRSLAQSLAASAAVAAVAFATFDALSFPMCAALTFLVLGCIGALWRLYVAPGTALPPDAPRPPATDRFEV